MGPKVRLLEEKAKLEAELTEEGDEEFKKNIMEDLAQVNQELAEPGVDNLEDNVIKSTPLSDEFKSVTNPKTQKIERILKNQQFFIFPNEAILYKVID